MFRSKILNIIALTLLAIVAVQHAQAKPDDTVTPPTTVRPRTTTRATTTTPRPTIVPTCRPAPRCTRRTPQVCARNRSGMCRRFNNICHLHGVNCPKGRPVQAWSNVPLTQCRGLRPNTTGRCVITCPRRPLRCPRDGQQLCVRSRNRQQCRLVANACVLRNLNCHTTPRGNWNQTKMAGCRNMCVGGKPQKCTDSRAG